MVLKEQIKIKKLQCSRGVRKKTKPAAAILKPPVSPGLGYQFKFGGCRRGCGRCNRYRPATKKEPTAGPIRQTRSKRETSSRIPSDNDQGERREKNSTMAVPARTPMERPSWILPAGFWSGPRGQPEKKRRKKVPSPKARPT